MFDNTEILIFEMSDCVVFVCLEGLTKGAKCTLSSAQESRDIAFCPVCGKNTYLSEDSIPDGTRLCTRHWARVNHRTNPKATENNK